MGCVIIPSNSDTGQPTIEKFRYFHRHFPHLDIESLIEHYAVFGGLEAYTTLTFSDTLEASIRANILERYHFLKTKILPPPMLERQNRRLLRAVAVSDGKTINVLRRAAMGRGPGHGAYDTLRQMGVLHKEASRETLPPPVPGRRRKKEERRYTVQDKIRFTHPFHRFWYTFVEPHASSIEAGDYEPFFADLKEGFDRFVSFTFEELSNALIQRAFDSKDPVSEKGTYWDRHNEFDLLARTRSRRLIVGECKWKGHKICKSLLSKLRSKCERSGLSPDYYALFSRSGFSKELQNAKDPTILCFDLHDFEKLLEDKKAQVKERV